MMNSNLIFVWILLAANLFVPVAAVTDSTIVFEQPKVPQGDPPPKTDPGVDRNPCPELAIPLSAIAPSDLRTREGTETILWGQTLRESPELWFYIPYSPDAIDSASIRILDRERFEIAPEQTVAISKTPGIIRVVSPIPLERDRWYQVQLKLNVYCRAGAPSETLRVAANVYRIAPPAALTEALNRAKTRIEKANLYQQYGLWYDALNAISQLDERQFKPARDRLFDAVELSKFKEQPIAPCCLAP